MKIHYLITTLEGGGAENVVPRIVEVMRSAGHDVEVTAIEPRDMAAARLLDEAGIGYRVLFQKRRNKLAMIRAFTKLIRRSRPDIIWTSLSAAGLVGLVTGTILRIPVVCWKHSASVRMHTRLTKGLCKLWIADSPSVANFLSGKLSIAADQVVTWPLFEQMRFSQPTPAWYGQQILQIGSMGRLHPVKNYDLLIEAVARLLNKRPDLAGRFHLTIVGDGSERDRLEGLIARHRIQSSVSLPGSITDVRPFLQSLHLYVQPSRYEGMCLAAHEAMSAGLPVIATPVGELIESIRTGKGGILLEGDIVGSCAAAIETLIQHPERLPQMGQSGKDYIEKTYSKAAFDKAGLAAVRSAEALLPEAH